jgi:hypothetical protein
MLSTNNGGVAAPNHQYIAVVLMQKIRFGGQMLVNIEVFGID